MDKLNKKLEGIDIYGLNVGGFTSVNTKDNHLVGYSYLTVSLLEEILKQLKKMNGETEELELKEEIKEEPVKIETNNVETKQVENLKDEVDDITGDTTVKETKVEKEEKKSKKTTK